MACTAKADTGVRQKDGTFWNERTRTDCFASGQAPRDQAIFGPHHIITGKLVGGGTAIAAD